MAVSFTQLCRPTDIDSSMWCLKNLYSLGEGTVLIAIPTWQWNQLRDSWTKITTPGGPVLVPESGVNVVRYTYNAPSDLTSLFTAADAIESLYLDGNALIFNPTVGNAIEADGTPYQTSTFALPIGSSKEYDMLSQYMQSKAWTFVKINNDNTILHVYGGPRGYFPTPDELSEMMYSGNNDAKGKTTLPFTMAKASYTIEYLVNSSTNKSDALINLMRAIRTAICLPASQVNWKMLFPFPITFTTATGADIASNVATLTGSGPVTLSNSYAAASWIEALTNAIGNTIKLKMTVNITKASSTGSTALEYKLTYKGSGGNPTKDLVVTGSVTGSGQVTLEKEFIVSELTGGVPITGITVTLTATDSNLAAGDKIQWSDSIVYVLAD